MSEKKSSPIVNNEEIERIIEQLPKIDYFWNKIQLYQWEGFWSTLTTVKAAMVFKATFKSKPNDVLLASSMKTGSTWLKAICVSIMQGNKEEEEDLLVKDNPHFHVPTIEAMNYYLKTPTHDLYTMPSPRLFHTHLPYRVLPDSIKNSDNCKIIYITRNPKDTIISMWHFFNNRKRLEDLFSLEEVVEYFCKGVHLYGPFFEHVLEYWEESKKKPQKILFLKYEDLKIDPKKEVAKIALFLGKSFGNEEDLEIVLNKCSLERLKNLEVNKSGSIFSYIHNSAYFRKGVVGDWKNHMTPEMEEQLDKITKLKLQGSGLEL
ncbi:cytosolic sulfotransferase 5-like [Solanum stenotomum]|uniref:cytosolic sulfotransferase 5-like n=1 Tax=Solanum stenotomum TaxID=172797 RepID=UPI0020D0A28A|nr:cytosolic sulfotransferase 5-like [Solanum stenotomum]